MCAPALGVKAIGIIAYSNSMLPHPARLCMADSTRLGHADDQSATSGAEDADHDGDAPHAAHGRRASLGSDPSSSLSLSRQHGSAAGPARSAVPR